MGSAVRNDDAAYKLTGTHLGIGHKSSVNVTAFKRDFNAINVIGQKHWKAERWGFDVVLYTYALYI